MRIPARALKPLVAMAIAAASFGCIAPAVYAENAAAAVISDATVIMSSSTSTWTVVRPSMTRLDKPKRRAVGANRFPTRNQTRP